jgi:hypothetical protein
MASAFPSPVTSAKKLPPEAGNPLVNQVELEPNAEPVDSLTVIAVEVIAIASALPSPFTSAKNRKLLAEELLSQVCEERNAVPDDARTRMVFELTATASALPSPVTSAKKVPFAPEKADDAHTVSPLYICASGAVFRACTIETASAFSDV